MVESVVWMSIPLRMFTIELNEMLFKTIENIKAILFWDCEEKNTHALKYVFKYKFAIQFYALHI